MRTLLALLAGFGLAVLVFTNPGPDDFRAFVRARSEAAIRRETGEGTFGRLLSRFGAQVAGALVNRVSDRDDYGLFSVYTIDFGGDGQPDERWRFVGAAGRFFEIEAPASLRNGETR
ncbi:DUF4359 domain-containing protein [Rhodocaloribacter sp.]